MSHESGNVKSGRIIGVHLILDNYSTYKMPRDPSVAWQATPLRVHFTPTYSFWINLLDQPGRTLV